MTVADESLVELQTRLAFQEDTVEQLGRLLHAQQQELQELRADVRRLQELIRQLTPALVGGPADEPPPHY